MISLSEILHEHEKLKLKVFTWKDELDAKWMLVMAFLFACFTGLLAQFKIYLWWTPVPITLQTTGVFLSAIYLGKKWGTVSQCIYVGIGALGMPWFAGGKGGLEVLIGPTAGYLVGFIFAAIVVGHHVESCSSSFNSRKLFAILLLANFGIIHLIGLMNLYFWYAHTQGVHIDLLTLLVLGCFPFVPGDVLKIIVTINCTWLIYPSSSAENQF